MRYYQQTPTTYSTFEAPEDKSPLELRPSLEKGEEAHVRDCLVWHSPSPRHTFGRHGYRMYTHNGQNYWTSQSCGNPSCRTCSGTDQLINRDVGYVRRNELGRTVDRGFSSKPRKERLQEGDYDDGNWTQRFNPPSMDTARGMRDPFNRPINGDYGRQGPFDYDKDARWNNRHCDTYSRGCQGGGCDSSTCRGGNGAGGASMNQGYDLPTYRRTFPRIDEKDQGSVTYRSPAGNDYMPGGDGGSRPVPMGQTYRSPATGNDYAPGGQTYRALAGNDYMSGGDGGISNRQAPMGQTYRSPAAAGNDYTPGGSTYRAPPMDYGTSGPAFPASSYDDMPVGGGAGGAVGGNGAGAATARGNDMPFPRKDDQKGAMKTAGPRRELKGPNTAVAFTV